MHVHIVVMSTSSILYTKPDPSISWGHCAKLPSGILLTLLINNTCEAILVNDIGYDSTGRIDMRYCSKTHTYGSEFMLDVDVVMLFLLSALLRMTIGARRR